MKHPRTLLQAYLVKTTPKSGVIKKYAHAFTLAACGLVVPSIWAIFLHRQGLKENEPELVWGAETLWKAHLGLTLVVSVLWLVERPKKTEYLPVEPLENENDEAL